MVVLAGTSGFSYPEWKGCFYPEGMKSDGMLAHYAGRLAAVEINNTFYKLPRRELIESWAAQVPAQFRFVLKASQRITHMARLDPGKAGEPLGYLWQVAGALGERLGPLLFQTPPNLKPDLERLRGFLALLPAGMRAAFEFRHPGWYDPAVLELLRGAGAAWCIAEDDGDPEPPVAATADWGYLRLRRTEYAPAALAAWAERLRAQPWREAWVFFKHEGAGCPPLTALAFQQLMTG